MKLINFFRSILAVIKRKDNRKLSDDRHIFHKFIDEISDCQKILSVGVNWASIDLRDRFPNCKRFVSIDYDWSTFPLSYRSDKHYICDYEKFKSNESFEVLLMFGIYDYCSHSATEFIDNVFRLVNENGVVYMIVNFNGLKDSIAVEKSFSELFCVQKLSESNSKVVLYRCR